MQQDIKILIVEDEEIAARKLRNLLAGIDPAIKCIGVSDSIESCVKQLESGDPYPDLILMDIELADGQSFDIFLKIDVKCPVIFTTAYDEFALKAFKVNSIDYLLKPIKKEELTMAIEKWRQLSEKRQPALPAQLEKAIEHIISRQSGDTHKKRFLVRNGQRLVPLATENIAYFYTEDKVVFIKTQDDKRFMLDFTLDELENVLDPKEFFRANRQFILNHISVDAIHTWFNGKLKVSILPKYLEEVVISREKAPDFKTWIGE